MNGRSDAYIFTSATVIAEIYIDEVFDPHVKLFRDLICNNFLLMDDNARTHRVSD